MARLGGAAPLGACDERAAAGAVQEMFDRIAPRYDQLNHLLSLNIDRIWWRRTASSFQDVLRRPEARILDVCCGTGQMAMALLKRRPQSGKPLLAVDFSHSMLMRGTKRVPGNLALLIEADALRLPLRDESIDLITTAFGFRNLVNYEAGLQEFRRVLRPGGSLGILDFGEPGGVLGRLYSLYFRHVLPRIGYALSGVAGAYQYLPASVKKFPPPERMVAAMRAAGFQEVSWDPYNFGVAALYRGVRS